MLTKERKINWKDPTFPSLPDEGLRMLVTFLYFDKWFFKAKDAIQDTAFCIIKMGT